MNFQIVYDKRCVIAQVDAKHSSEGQGHTIYFQYISLERRCFSLVWQFSMSGGVYVKLQTQHHFDCKTALNHLFASILD